MREVKLYQDLLKIDNGKLSIALRNDPARITINSLGDMEGETLKEIIKLVDKYKADLILMSYGVLEIKFKEV